MSQVKLCVDCKHYRAGLFATCTHPDIPPKNLATGEREWADWVRKFGRCGRDATLFLAKTASKESTPVDPELKDLLDGPRGKAGWYVRALWRINRWLSRCD